MTYEMTYKIHDKHENNLSKNIKDILRMKNKKEHKNECP